MNLRLESLPLKKTNVSKEIDSTGDGIPIFKFVLVGARATESTTFVKRHFTGELENKYISETKGYHMHDQKYTIWNVLGSAQLVKTDHLSI
ncbi:hypothetical protein KIN20_024083 [Parelaphostrongylus tenuis]|uniref:Uncharacterized protein n=1 Tax=Parelaphostrongylus tenuis TaxID=148309 RepID=A0AAD5QXJ6_PARTN|nr:hypothetical protein KIN20_024083 [Parelaphostrongylus tenuis]